MEIIIAGKSYVLEKEIKNNEDLLAFINERLWAGDLILIQLIVEGSPVDGDYEDYILNQYIMGKRIEIVAKGKKEYLVDMVKSAREYLENCIPNVSLLVDELYAGIKNETWNKVSDLLEAFEWLLTLVVELEKDKTMSKYLNQDIGDRMKETVNNLGEVHLDPIQLADLIQYEVIPIFEELQQIFEEDSWEEVIVHELN